MEQIVNELANAQERLEELELDETTDLSASISLFQSIPGLVGFWPMSSVQRSTGNVYDLSGQGRTLLYNGNPVYNYRSNILVPFISLDGVGDYLSRADETDLDILGTETIYHADTRGLTYGGWFWFDTIASTTTFYGKRGGTPGSGFGWFMQHTTTNIINYLSVDGTALVSNSVANTTTGEWMFIIANFDPSVSLNLFINGTKTTNTTSIPASIANITGAFSVGAINGGTEPMAGRASFCFVSANFLDDTNK